MGVGSGGLGDGIGDGSEGIPVGKGADSVDDRTAFFGGWRAPRTHQRMSRVGRNRGELHRHQGRGCTERPGAYGDRGRTRADLVSSKYPKRVGTSGEKSAQRCGCRGCTDCGPHHPSPTRRGVLDDVLCNRTASIGGGWIPGQHDLSGPCSRHQPQWCSGHCCWPDNFRRRGEVASSIAADRRHPEDGVAANHKSGDDGTRSW